eukprot:scaffold2243_cov122-Cylindrotheca_fusiformis.AAC.26
MRIRRAPFGPCLSDVPLHKEENELWRLPHLMHILPYHMHNLTTHSPSSASSLIRHGPPSDLTCRPIKSIDYFCGSTLLTEFSTLFEASFSEKMFT